MSRLVVAEHAFKHGLSEESIRFAWENRMASQHRKAPYEDQVVAIGLTEDGRVVELIGSQKPSAVVIYHAMEPPAMEPPTKRVLFELGLLARRR